MRSRIVSNRTIIADHWTSEPLDWRKRIVTPKRTPRNNEDKKYKTTIDRACIDRHFFVTRNGRVGLCQSNLKKSDEVWILLGGKTLFILRQSENSREKGKLDSKDDTMRKYHKALGESFVDGLMCYEGSMEDDLQKRKSSRGLVSSTIKRAGSLVPAQK